MRAHLNAQLPLVRGHIQRDDPAGGERPEQLDRDVPEATDADHRHGGAGQQAGQQGFDHVVRRQAGIGEETARTGSRPPSGSRWRASSISMYSAMAPGAPRPGEKIPRRAACGQ